MPTSSRWLAVGVGLLLGVAVTLTAIGTLHGQPAVPAVPPVVPKEFTSYRDVVKRVLPAVVSIEAKQGLGRPAAKKGGVPLPPNVPEEFRKFFEANPGEVKPDPNLGFGSGVVIDPAGVVLTAWHVVDGAETVEVTLTDGRKFTSKDILTDAKTDLAVIRLKVEGGLPALDLGDSDAMEVGDRVLAVGAPFGLAGSVTHGIVSAKSRTNLKLNQYEDFLQTDAAVNPGNSGGPLVSLDGKVIGINSAIKTKTGGFQGVGLAVSSNLARDIADQLLKNGKVKRGYLGVGVRDLDDGLADRLGVKKGGGVVVTRVYENAPGDKAGLLVSDVITAVGGTAVTDVNALPRVVAKLPLGQKTEVVFVRDGKAFSLEVAVEEQPDDFAPRKDAPAPPPKLDPGVKLADAGLTVVDMTAQIAVQLRYPAGTTGAAVIGVERGSFAAAAGLNRGNIIVKVDKTPVATAKAFAEALAAAPKDRGALLSLLRPNGDIEFVVLKLK